MYILYNIILCYIILYYFIFILYYIILIKGNGEAAEGDADGICSLGRAGLHAEVPQEPRWRDHHRAGLQVALGEVHAELPDVDGAVENSECVEAEG